MYHDPIVARAPPNTSPFFPDPTFYNITSPTQASSSDSSKAVRTIIEYFFLVMALFVACILIFRRVFYLRKRDKRSPLINTNQDHHPNTGGSSFSFPRTTGLPRVSLQGYPLLNTYIVSFPLPTAISNNPRRTRAQDIDLEGRRVTSAGTEIDHDGPLRDKDALPKYEYHGGPPKYAELEAPQNHPLATGDTIPPLLLSPPPPTARSSEPTVSTTESRILLSNQTTTTPSSDQNSPSSVASDSVPSTRP